jgi:molybdopterin-guanine dinucleotide biosynthesis protein A
VALAIVLAGGQKLDLNSGKPELVNEASIRIGKRYMFEYVVAALRRSEHIDRIVIAGPLAILAEVFEKSTDCITLVESGSTQIESFIKALEAADVVFERNERILIVTADIPLLTTAAIDDFVSLCVRQKGEMFYPIVKKETNESKYPGSVRTYAQLKDGTFTGGNLILIDADIVDRCIPVAKKLVQYRKSPLRLASYIGLGVLIRYLLGSLSVKDAEKKVSSLMGVHAVAVISSFAEIGIDVDKFSDLAVVNKHILEKHEFIR